MIPAPSRLSPVKGSDTLMSSRPGTIAMQSDARYYQFTVENQVLDHVKKALRNSLTADADRMGVNRKVSTVQFVTESLVRHLERLLDLEDEVGLVDPTELDKPHLAERASVLQQEHRSIRRASADADAPGPAPGPARASGRRPGAPGRPYSGSSRSPC